MTLDRLYKNFELLENWQDRYRFIIDMGQKIPVLKDEQRNECTKVHGCMSNVHMTIDLSDDQPPKIQFIADSDSTIVNGLIAVLHVIYDDKTAEEIKKVDIKAIFKELGLEKHISPIRRNGFFAMVDRLNSLVVT